MKITKKILISSLAITPLTTLAFIPSVVRPKEVETYNNTNYTLCFHRENIEDYIDVIKKLIEEFGICVDNDFSINLALKFKEKKDELNKKIKIQENSLKIAENTYKLQYYKYLDGFKKVNDFDINEYLCHKDVKKYVCGESRKFCYHIEFDDSKPFGKWNFGSWRWITKDDFKKVPRLAFYIFADGEEYKNLSYDEKIKKVIENNNNQMLFNLEKKKTNIKIRKFYLDFLNNKLKLLEKLEDNLLTLMMKKDYKKSMNKYYSSEALKNIYYEIKNLADKLQESINSESLQNDGSIKWVNHLIEEKEKLLAKLNDNKKMLEKHFKLK